MSLIYTNTYKLQIQLIIYLQYNVWTLLSFPNYIDKSKSNLCAIQDKTKTKTKNIDALKNKSLKNSFKNKVQILHKII